jgi:ligand-binding SRPBCC domain-containing protein
MPVYTLKRDQFVPRPLKEVFDFFSNAANLEKITPAWLNFQILAKGPIHIQPGTLLNYRLKWHGLPIRWVTEIIDWNAAPTSSGITPTPSSHNREALAWSM